MSWPCKVPDCGHSTTGFSRLCERHKKADRRHGHPEQTAVLSSEVRPYLQRVERRMKANPGSPAWTVLDARWQRVLAAAQQSLAASQKGPYWAPEVAAAKEVVKLDEHPGGQAVAALVLALYAMRYERPQRFANERAFEFQVCRRVRGGSVVNRGSYWNHKTRKTATVYRDLPPRVSAVLAGWLRAAFGDAGAWLALEETERAAREREEARRLQEAISALA
jgi:hypothetical protein